MPHYGFYCDPGRGERLREVHRQVRAKFPALIEGSSGWHRAVANRLKRSKP